MCLASHNTDCSILMNLSDNIHYQYVPLYSYNYVLSYCSRDSVYNDIMGSRAVLTIVTCVTCAPQTQDLVCMFSDSSSAFEHTQNYYVYPHTTKVYMCTHSIIVYVHTQLNCLCANTAQVCMCTHNSTVYVHTQLKCKVCGH